MLHLAYLPREHQSKCPQVSKFYNTSREPWPILATLVPCAISSFSSPSDAAPGSSWSSVGPTKRSSEIRRTLASNPNDPEGLEIEGLCHLRRRDLPRALEALQRALAAQPENAHPHYLYGFALRESGRTAEAEAPLGEALRRCPDEPVYLRALAELKSELRAHADALALALRATEVAPERGANFVTLGFVASAAGDKARAREAYERAVALDPADYRGLEQPRLPRPRGGPPAARQVALPPGAASGPARRAGAAQPRAAFDAGGRAALPVVGRRARRADARAGPRAGVQAVDDCAGAGGAAGGSWALFARGGHLGRGDGARRCVGWARRRWCRWRSAPAPPGWLI